MPCYGPLTAYYGKDVSPNGKRPLVFDERKAHSGVPVRIPCGRCIGCKLERSRQWAVRCMHEKRMHSQSAFVTATYEKLPEGGTLVKRDLQLFMKRLRKRRPAGLRFFACGEYGETTQRPHYHVLLLNTSFPDQKVYKKSAAGEQMYTSAELEEVWGNGLCVVAGVTFDSCAYVARYVTKKITGEQAAAHYGGRLPEFTVMSRRPGLGVSYLEKYGPEIYEHDSVVQGGREVAIPRFYDVKYAAVDSVRVEAVKKMRRIDAQKMPKEEKSAFRRYTRERVTKLNLERKARDF